MAPAWAGPTLAAGRTRSAGSPSAPGVHPEAARWIRALGLTPHPEGGFFREIYRADEGIASAHLPARFGGDRAFATAIYFLLEGRQVSRLHRLRSDELWHFHAGGPLAVDSLSPDGAATRAILGPDVRQGRSSSTWCRPDTGSVPRWTAPTPTRSWAARWRGFDFSELEPGPPRHSPRAVPPASRPHRAPLTP
jgi:predicted cupin superfamily sugar epimerase